MVDAVNRAARTVDCTPLDDAAPLLDCNLQANQDGSNGMTIYPKVGSYVIVGLLEGLASAVVLLYDEVEEVSVKIGQRTLQMTADGVLLNGGELGGLVNVEGLTKRLNNIEDSVNELKRAIST